MITTVDKIRKVSEQILIKNGVPEAHAKVVADTIVYAHARGKHTHGLGRMNIYLRKIRENLMPADTPMEILNDFGAIQHMDAHNGFGQVATYYGVKTAIEKAKQFGIGLVSVKDSNNFGTAGYFAKLAADEGMIGIVMGNSGPAIAPPGGKLALFGTNPISLAMPTEIKERPFLFDMATSMAARGKIRLAAKNGESIPLGWALDKDGNPTTDANAAIEGTMLPIGGYKGAGISMAIDLLAGMLSGSAFAGDVKGLNHKTDYSRYGHMIIVIDYTKFMSEEEYKERMQYFIDRTHDFEGSFPGEGSYKILQGNQDELNVPDKQYAEINEMASEFGIEERL